MIAVAVVALSLGGLLYKRQRDRYLARATWHASMRTGALSSLARVTARFAQPDPVPALERSSELAWAIDRVLGIPTGGWSQSVGDDRSREDQEAIEQAKAASRRRVLAEYRRRESERLRKQVDYHAALVQKYMHAASHPWLPVGPDLPEPQ
jgi:hypothetical protein